MQAAREHSPAALLYLTFDRLNCTYRVRWCPIVVVVASRDAFPLMRTLRSWLIVSSLLNELDAALRHHHHHDPPAL